MFLKEENVVGKEFVSLLSFYLKSAFFAVLGKDRVLCRLLVN
jgi:hypothetical protein